MPRAFVRRLAVLVSAGALLASMLGAKAAHAQKPTSQAGEYSPYEKETITQATHALGVTIDPHPEGKVIRRIDTVRLDVLEERDPVPEKILGIKVRRFANSLHYTTRDFIVRREMLLKEGEPWVQVIIDETARNIRSRMTQVSVVIVVPIATGEPDSVDVLVITKDLWSLRLSWDLALTSGGLENLLIVPQETNLLGLQHTLQTRFQLQPESYSLAGAYKVPRFGESWIGASASASIIMNRRRGEPEGSSAAISVGQGLYSTRTAWSWTGDVGYSVGVARRYSNAAVFLYNSPTTQAIDNIPFEYKTRSYSASVGAVRSFGWGFKNNFSLTMNAGTSSYDTFDLSRFAPQAAADFRSRALPTGESRVYPALAWSTFTTNFLRTLDIATLALQEDYRLGHDVSVSVYPVTRALGSSRDLVGVSAKIGYSLALLDGLVGASASTFAEVCLTNEAGCEGMEGRVSDGAVSGSFGAVTPRLGFGRLVMNTSFTNRYRNYLNARTFAGGDDRLRGYPTNFFFGKDSVFYNIEFRSRAIEILKLQLGGVAFFDAGDVAQGFDMLNAKQSVGVGFRLLIPQLNRMVFRGDLGFPLKRGPFPETGSAARVDPVGFYFAFEQAFSP